MIPKSVWENLVAAALVIAGIVLLQDEQALLGIGLLLTVVALYLRVIATQQRGQTELLALIAEGQDK